MLLSFNNGKFYEISIKTIRKGARGLFLHRGPNWFALFHNVYVITKEEHHKKIEEYFEQNGNPNNIKFFYVDIPKVYKKIFKGSFYSVRLNIWQKKAYLLAKEICEECKIDIIHQITPVEIRSIGNYGKIPNVKFVCGPIGGGENIPKGLRSYVKVNVFFEVVRNIANKFSLIKYKANGTLKYSDMILFANEETKKFMKCEKNKVATSEKCITEIGIEDEALNGEHLYFKDEKKCVFLVVGRLIYRKGHSFLLDALAELPSDLEYECKIVGAGKESKKLQKKCNKKGILNKVRFIGKVSFEEMNDIYLSADVLIVPSIRETTGSVLLEGMAKGLPVIAINKFGSAVLVDENTGWLYAGNNKKEYIENLKNILINSVTDFKTRENKGKTAKIVAQEYVWSKKLEIYNKIYSDLIL